MARRRKPKKTDVAWNAREWLSFGFSATAFVFSIYTFYRGALIEDVSFLLPGSLKAPQFPHELQTVGPRGENPLRPGSALFYVAVPRSIPLMLMNGGNQPLGFVDFDIDVKIQSGDSILPPASYIADCKNPDFNLQLDAPRLNPSSDNARAAAVLGPFQALPLRDARRLSNRVPLDET